jgi:hypothetical protein
VSAWVTLALMGASKRAKKIRDANEFSLPRLKAMLERPRDGSGIVFSWSLADILNARNAQMLGRFALAARMAESMRTDDAIFVASTNRLAPQRCVPVELVAASEKPKALSVAAEAEALYGENGIGIRAGALASINLCLVDHGIAFGCNVATPRDDGSRIDIEHRYWPIEYVRWDHFRRIYVTRVDPTTVQPGDLLLQDPRLGAIGSYEVEIVHGDGRWVIYSNHEVDAFKKEAAILAGCIVWARHAMAIRDWAKGSVSHGNAKFVGEMPSGVVLQKDGKLTPEALAMIQLLLDLANGDSPVGIRPAGSKTDFLTNTSTAWQVWTELVGNGERAAARIYLGTDGILGATGGAPGVDISQLFGVALTKVRGDLGCIQRAFQTGVLEVWTALNFGDSTLTPTRRYMLPDADMEAWRKANAVRRTAFFADIKAQRDNGFEVTQASVEATAKEYDVTAPALPKDTGTKAPTIALAPTDLANVISVNEARASSGVGVLMLPDGKTPDPDGMLTIGAFVAKTNAAHAPTGATGPPA